MIKQLGTVLFMACLAVSVLPFTIFATTGIETKIDQPISYQNRTKNEYLTKLADKHEETIEALPGTLTDEKRQMALNEIYQTYQDARNAILNSDSEDKIMESYHRACDSFDVLLAFLELQPIVLPDSNQQLSLHKKFVPSSLFMSVLAVSILLLVSLFVLAARNHKIIQTYRRNVEKADMLVMLSQIKQHFVCNSLISIKQLYEQEPAKATAAMDHFIYYIRENLYSLTGNTRIPFLKELKHVQDYLYLEQLRFGDRLHIEWDITFTEYQLPPLSLQPIIENAVRHGINQKADGGTIVIRSEEIDNSAILTIIDTGAGYDPSTMPGGTRPHIGLTNVSKRLASQCGGSLDIQSQPGAGTTVRITVPLSSHNCSGC